MKKKLVFFLLILLCTTSGTWAQSQQKSRYLKIGDKVPDFFFPVKNYKKKTAHMSDFRGKLVIIDLWATWCGSCISLMPHMEELQKKFDGKLQVILMTQDDDKRIARLRSDNVKNNRLPSVTKSRLAALFDYTYLPTHVWIDATGVIKYITSATGATEKNISDFLSGKDIQLEEKKDITLNNDEPMQVRWYPYYKGFTFSTFLAPVQKIYHTAGGTGAWFNDDGTIKQIDSDLSSLSDLYKLSFGKIETNRFSDSRVLFEFKDSLKYKPDSAADYRDSKTPYFMYELRNANHLSNERIYKHMRSELDIIFHLESKMEKRSVPVYIIKRIPGSEISISNSKQVKGNYNGKSYSVDNISWRFFFNRLDNLSDTPLQLIDETGIDKETKMKVHIDFAWSDLTAVNNSLKPYGLYVSKEIRSMDCIVLTDAKE